MNEFSILPPLLPADVLQQHDYGTPHKTAVVAGLAQGGTSAVAAVVDALGFPMRSDRSTLIPNFESSDRPNVGDTAEIWAGKIPSLNEHHVNWGLKDTIIDRFAPEWVNAALRNPYYLIVAKDAVAITQRRGLVQTASLQRVVKQQQKLLHWVLALPPAPILVISYHRVVASPERFVQVVAKFLEFTGTQEQIDRAAKRISPTGGYIQKE